MLYHGSQPERDVLLKEVRRSKGPMKMTPVVITSFEIAMIDRKKLQVRSQLLPNVDVQMLSVLWNSQLYSFSSPGIVMDIKMSYSKTERIPGSLLSS